jgi:hypothetical protein
MQCLGFTLKRHQSPTPVLVRRTHEGLEKGMRLQGLRLELGMKLTTQIPGVILDFTDLDVHAIRSFSGYP